MKYIFFTYVGDSLPVAYRLQQDGYEVIVGQVTDKKDVHSSVEKNVREEDRLSYERTLSLYDGMLHKVPAGVLIEQMKKYPNPEEYFVFFDRNNLFKFAQQIIDLGFKGNFPTEEDYLFELNREEAKAFVKEHYPKLHVAEVRDFKHIKDAIRFLQDTEDLWVLKGKDDEVKTFVPDIDDLELARKQLIQNLESNKEKYENAGFILELLINPVIELTPERIYYDGQPIVTTIDIENKPFGSGNISIQTGCSQDLVFPISMDDKINAIAFPPIVDELAKKHKGLFYWDASILIDKKSGKLYFGEFCSNRPGYNSLFSEISQCKSVNHYFESLANKKNPFTLGTVGCSVLLLNPEKDENSACHPPRDIKVEFKKDIESHLWLWDVYQKDDQLVTAGDDWNLGAITGNGKSIEEAVTKMYKNVDNFSFVGAYYRPKSDFLSLEYSSSILNRLNYGLNKGLYQIPFNVNAVIK